MREDDSQQNRGTSSALMSSQREDVDGMYQIKIKEINSDIIGMEERPIEKKSNLNSTKDLPNISQIQLQTICPRDGPRLECITYRNDSASHQTSPIQSQKSVTALRLQEIKKKSSEMLFNNVMDN